MVYDGTGIINDQLIVTSQFKHYFSFLACSVLVPYSPHFGIENAILLKDDATEAHVGANPYQFRITVLVTNDVVASIEFSDRHIEGLVPPRRHLWVAMQKDPTAYAHCGVLIKSLPDLGQPVRCDDNVVIKERNNCTPGFCNASISGVGKPCGALKDVFRVEARFFGKRFDYCFCFIGGVVIYNDQLPWQILRNGHLCEAD